MPPKKSAAKPTAGRTPVAKKKPGKQVTAKPGPRADKGDGEAAVQARIKALNEPSRSIIAKLHALVTKHAPDLDPTVRWGFAVYSRGGKMLVVASGYTKYARLGFTADARIKGGEPYIEYKDAAEIDEAKVVKLLERLR